MVLARMQREEYSKKYADMHIQNMEIMKYMSKYTKTLKIQSWVFLKAL